jgi:hypothetical protein
MQLDSDAGRLRDIRAAGGVRVLGTNRDFWAIFNRKFSAVTAGDLEIESRSPGLTCRSSDVDGMTKDEALTVGTTDYRMLRAEPDFPAPGWTILILRS